MSALLDELIKARREGAATYEKLLEHYVELIKKSETPESNPRYPESIRHSGALRSFYDNFGEDEALALALDNAVRENKLDDFRRGDNKDKKIKKALFDVLKDHDEVGRAYAIVVEQGEY